MQFNCLNELLFNVKLIRQDDISKLFACSRWTVPLQMKNIQANSCVIKAAQLKGTVAPEHAAFLFRVSESAKYYRWSEGKQKSY